MTLPETDLEKATFNLDVDFSIMVGFYVDKIGKIQDGKHKTERNQDLDKIIHYFYVMIKHIKDMNDWFKAFGTQEEKQ